MKLGRLPCFLVVIIGLSGALSPNLGLACSCGGYAPWVTTEEIVERYDAVFWGQVDTVHLEGFAKVATLRVFAVWKGDVPREVQVRTPAEGTACGVGFTPGQPYLVFATLDSNELYGTHLCDPTTVHERATCSIQSLGQPIAVLSHSAVLDLAISNG